MNVLNQGLEGLMGWTRSNKQKLNPDNMKVLLEDTNSGLGNGLMLMLEGVARTLSTLVCSLRVFLDPGLLFDVPDSKGY